MISRINLRIVLITILVVSSIVKAECPLDHLIIGCNRDGIEGTDDDRQLFVDCRQKYRDSGEIEYANWFYPLHKSIFPSYSYRVGEPGFDAYQSTNPNASYTYDPNRAPAGEPEVNYNILIECVDMSAGIRAVHKDYPQFIVDTIGQSFSHSYIYHLRGDSHIHMSYQAVDGENLHWITFCLSDSLDDGERYEPSEPFTIVFNIQPLAGDLAIDGIVDISDLAEFSRCWLASDSSIHNDYHERADSDRNGSVDFRDFALLAANWLKPLE
ncbi:MAG: hypothetical protein JW837_01700 [Sedimentisphaerales bacterium]|nr:hypothetical protein [Sedimentisphaerales bacterium]